MKETPLPKKIALHKVKINAKFFCIDRGEITYYIKIAGGLCQNSTTGKYETLSLDWLVYPE